MGERSADSTLSERYVGSSLALDPTYGFCSMCGPKFCAMEITQQVRDYASNLNERQVEVDKATTVVDLVSGMVEMSQKFRDTGVQVYVDADKVKAANKALG